MGDRDSVSDNAPYDENGRELPQGTASDTIADIEAYEKEFQKWEQRGDAILKRYRDQRSEATNLRVVSRKFNILWSNTETLKPTLYARLPRVQVERRFKDADPTGRTACEIAERAGNYLLETSPFDNVMRMCTQDLLLPGRAVAWINYKADMAAPEEAMDTEDAPDGDKAEQADEEKTEPALEKIHEKNEVIYIYWRDFGHSPKRTWQEVTRAWRVCHMTRKQCVERFGEELGNDLPLDRKHEDTKDNKTDSLHDTSTIYEVWDKETRKVCWVHKTKKDYLDEIDPPVDLEGFFPFPRPLWSTMTNDTLVPVPLYALYQDQAAELDKITNRIGRFTDALKIAGVYDSSVPELQRILSPNGTPDNMLVAVSNWAGLTEKGGVQGAVQLLPLDMIAQTLLQLYEARTQILNVIYQVTGISDIMRGASDPRETAEAQGLKGQYGSIRIKDTQAEVARFSRDAARIMVEIAIEMYEPETLYEMVQADQFCQLSPREQQKAQTMAQFTQATRQPAPPPPKPMDEFNAALRMLRDDKMRSFHIDIETDSTIAMNEQEDKQSVTEFIGATASFFQAFGPMIQAEPALVPVAGEMLLYASRRFKAGRAVEGAIEKFVAQMAQQAQQPKPPSPEMLKIQAQTQADQDKAKLQAQKDAASTQNDREKNQVDAQAKAADLELTKQKNNAELALKARELALKEREHALHERELNATLASGERSHALEVAKAQSAGVSGIPKAPAHPLETHLKNVTTLMADQAKQHAASISGIADAMHVMAKSMSAPRRLVKDPKTGEKRSELVLQ